MHGIRFGFLIASLALAGAAQAAGSGTIAPSSNTVDIVANASVVTTNPGLDVPSEDGAGSSDGETSYGEFYGGPVQGLRTLDTQGKNPN
jgi:hypothetical protein